MVRKVFQDGSVPLVGLQEELRYPSGRTTGRTTLPRWIYSQRFYFEPRSRAGGEVRIFGFNTKKGPQRRDLPRGPEGKIWPDDF